MHSSFTTQTIRIKVPDQGFAGILLVVDSQHTMEQIRREVLEQLNIKHQTRNSMALAAVPFNGYSEPVFFPSSWTIEKVLMHGAIEFEIMITDMFQ